jgi:hypothetical protein
MRRSFNRVSDPNVVDDGKWMTVGMIKVFSDGRDVLNLATTISASTRVAARLRKKSLCFNLHQNLYPTWNSSKIIYYQL